MSDDKKPHFKTDEATADELIAHADRLKDSKEFQTLHAKFGHVVDDATLERAVKGLTSKGHKVEVAKTKEEALQLIKASAPTSGSISLGHSTTLAQVGFVAWLKTSPLAGVRNFKADAVKAMMSGDMAAHGRITNEGLLADVFYASVSAVTETGDLVWGDATGSRVAGGTAGRLVLVVGSNKIVATFAEAEHRLMDYSRPLEGVRAGIAYNFPSYQGVVQNFGAIRAANPFGAPRVHVIIVKEALGF